MSTNETATLRQLVQVFAIIQVHKPCRFVDKRDVLVDNVDKSRNPLGVSEKLQVRSASSPLRASWLHRIAGYNGLHLSGLGGYFCCRFLRCSNRRLFSLAAAPKLL